MSWSETYKYILSDLNHYSRGGSLVVKLGILLFSLPFQTLATYRLIKYCKAHALLRPFAVWLSYRQQVSSGCHLHHQAEIGEKCMLPHPTGIVIGAGVHIGDHVTIYQHVTIGSHGKAGSIKEYPFIDDEVIIFAGAVIIGNVKLGKGAKVAANSVVVDSVPPGVIVGGIPAKPLHQTSDKVLVSSNGS